MSAPKSRAGSMFQFALIFLLVYMTTQMSFRYFFPERYGPEKDISGVIVQVVDKTVKGQHHPLLVIKNRSEEDLVLEDRCPMPPVDVWKIEGETRTALTTQETALPCAAVTSVAAGASVNVDLGPWKYSLFGDYGNYAVQLPGIEDEESTAEFSIYEAGMMTQIFRTFITKPLLNGLIFVASMTPGYNLGIAIIILTIIVKLILFVPTQHAMEGQRKMQAVQPKMDAMKAKYKDNPKKMQEETMKLWKENKVNPMQSCLPMLIQFPILIGLFFTIRDGSVLALSEHLLYPVYQNLSWDFGTQFLGMDLTLPNVTVMPILLVVMQFFQMKLSFAANKKKEEKSGTKKKKEAASQQEVQQKVMMYGLPLMIGFFAIKFPAAVSLYWAASTVFAVGQQVYVNRKV
ncbi:MAG: YidC/Oxa1 family membrane protein insertase [Candidatus Peribacter sp.]|jgi:YidC/Oxa1 family membrane protein insertase|nr:YidC/Oxa1 family membrane protein insertase [Candidatus Peribacter sp.]MBT4393476.1 YidC/Oxa1 family membrane protein insertase [Candidatus Peribacter sp.]MBT4600835.1 YidC/Oxa1 family membrane protein insertase [Candidatus Peribacter sp.]MBT5149482.1 YidC/Oxa1 family membrane protein insertase [Candidatus Peribacter sp.]MBT5637319.1 YidC/Oxa1 family membrane protein insertase [Candidatus Peribacter sp.]